MELVPKKQYVLTYFKDKIYIEWINLKQFKEFISHEVYKNLGQHYRFVNGVILDI